MPRSTPRKFTCTTPYPLPVHSPTGKCVTPRLTHRQRLHGIPIFDLINQLQPTPRLIAVIQLTTAARIQEVLDLRHRDVTLDGMLFIRASKRSRSRVAYCPDILPRISQKDAHKDLLIFAPYNYWNYRRDIISQLGSHLPTTNSRRIVSNLFRRLAAQNAFTLSGGDLPTVSHTLGHCSPRSTEIYLGTGGSRGKNRRRNT